MNKNRIETAELGASERQSLIRSVKLSPLQVGKALVIQVVRLLRSRPRPHRLAPPTLNVRLPRPISPAITIVVNVQERSWTGKMQGTPRLAPVVDASSSLG